MNGHIKHIVLHTNPIICYVLEDEASLVIFMWQLFYAFESLTSSQLGCWIKGEKTYQCRRIWDLTLLEESSCNWMSLSWWAGRKSLGPFQVEKVSGPALQGFWMEIAWIQAILPPWSNSRSPVPSLMICVPQIIYSPQLQQWRSIWSCSWEEPKTGCWQEVATWSNTTAFPSNESGWIQSFGLRDGISPSFGRDSWCYGMWSPALNGSSSSCSCRGIVACECWGHKSWSTWVVIPARVTRPLLACGVRCHWCCLDMTTKNSPTRCPSSWCG